jgi:hypothetical protein
MVNVTVHMLVTSVSEDVFPVLDVELVLEVELVLVVVDVVACRATIPSAITAQYPDSVVSVKVTGRLTWGEDVTVYSEAKP